ncbi:DNA-binding transcriptional LysR family regulator [Catenuloplanes nepalensis]|uniref:DNA-binding transcriptional LysR family regulator n=1 Tax=Catenuloplanes nepalensis TaxID=587533 RepID=A0ABT9MSD3_9ACTN|nr:LysR substrate-binding domain-containing protein [Catenuloplanes nepalensis]MDP9794335.1 DNA-binding transcriptional LysR family regulator [Catenuloplanes nepalensis]
MPLEPGHLRLLALISRHSSTAAAAGELGISPAEAAQQLAHAERECGVPLLRRAPRGDSLTAAGHLLARHGADIDRLTAQASAGLGELLGRMSLRLRLGACETAALHLLPPVLAALRGQHPDADLYVSDVRPDRGLAMVEDGELDLVAFAGWDDAPKVSEQITLYPLVTDPLVVVLPDGHPLAADGRTLSLDALRAEPWAALPAGTDAREQLDRATGLAGFVPDVRFQAASYAAAQAFAGAGAGLTLTPRLALTGAPGTVHRDLTPPAPHRTLFAATFADTRLTPLATTVLTLLHDAATALTGHS